MSRRALIIAAGVVVLQGLLIVLWWYVERARTPEPTGPVAASVAVRAVEPLDVSLPPTTLRTVAGETFATGTPPADGMVLHFWGTWCPPCREELPRFLSRSRDSDVLVLAVAVDDDLDTLSAFFDGTVPPEVVERGDGLVNALAVRRLPQTVFVDSDGIARVRWVGAREWSEAEWEELTGER